MLEASSKLEFEKAALLRDQIDALRSGDVKKAARGGSRRGRARR
jgi:excinuclease ABC subunit B